MSKTLVLKTLSLELSRFPGLSRTYSLFPRLSSPRKCQNKVLGLFKFSRTHTKPENPQTNLNPTLSCDTFKF